MPDYLVLIDGQQFIRQGLPAAIVGAEHAHKAIVASPQDGQDYRDEAERRLMQVLSQLFQRLLPDLAARLAAGEMPSGTELQDAFRLVIEPQLVEAAVGEFERLGVQVGVSFDPAIAGQRLIEWSRDYTYSLVKDLTDTTVRLLQTAFAEFQSTPGMTRGQLETLLAPGFGERRASLLASTEVTRAYSQAMNEYQRELADSGISMLRRWETLADERVCEICGPLHHKLETEWRDRFPGGPPAHPACRCSVTLTVAR